MRCFWIGRLPSDFPSENERGAVLVATLVVMLLLMGVAVIETYSGYTNLLTSTNLRLATRARATAETNIDEAVYRLSLPQGGQGAITPDLSNPNWSTGIAFSSSPGSGKVASIQALGDWPATAYRAGSTTTLQYKKDANGNVIFYNRAIASTSPPFLQVTLPDVLGLHLVDPLATLLDQVYDRLCMLNLPSVGVGGLAALSAINVGGALGICPANTNLADLGYPVIQVQGSGVDARGAEREFLAEAVRTVQFTPLVPLAAGGTVNLNSNGFIDGVNHNPNIILTAGAGAGTGTTYGDDGATETTQGYGALAVKDSPDDNDLWLSGKTLTLGALGFVQHSIANVSLLLKLPLQFYTSMPRLYNRQISSTDTTSAWIDVDPLYRALNQITVAGIGLGGISVLVPITNLGIWEGVNSGYRAPIALSATATVQNAPIPLGLPLVTALTTGGTSPGNLVWNTGLFTWRNNNKGDAANFRGSSSLLPLAAVNTVCGPAIQGGPAPLTCRPAALANLPSLQFQTYLGLDATTFQDLLNDPDTDKTALSANQPPLGFTYINGNYTLKSTTLSPGASQFGLLYAKGNLDIQGNHTFKGLIFVDGNLTIQAGGQLTVLGAVMVRGNVTNVGTGTMTLLYSRQAANQGLQTSHPWRILSWADTAVQEEAE